MAVTGLLARLAARAPTPIFIAAGHGADPIVAALRASEAIELVATPRHATVLLVAGRLPDALHEPLRRLHDQVPAPRATAVVGADPAALGLPAAVAVEPGPGLVDAVRDLHVEVLAGQADDPALGPADSPVEWQGVGPFGTGGEGMMGGTPYGRSMAMTDDGRDGLALDRLALHLGPFLPGLPPGVTLDVGLQGDVLETVTVELAPAEPAPATQPTAPQMADGGPWLATLAELLALAGLGAMARGTARLAVDRATRAVQVGRLRARLDHTLGLRLATDGVGRIELDGTTGDVTDRWKRWLELAVAAPPADPSLARPVALDHLGQQLTGMEIGEAMLTLASLRPELAATARAGLALPPRGEA